MLDLTRERIKGLPAVAVQRQDCEKTSFPPASFDTAFLGLTFQLVNGPVAVAEMQRILKPGGNLILAIPTMEDLRLSDKLRCVMRNCRTYGTIRPPGTKLYTHLTLPPIIARGGFRILDVERLTDPAHPQGFSGLWLRAEKI